MKISILFFCLILCSCSTKVNTIQEIPQKPRDRPADAMTLCVDLKPISNTSFGGVVEKLDEVANEYQQCKMKHAELVEWVNRAPEYQDK